MRLLSMEGNGLPTEQIKEFNDRVLSIVDGLVKGSSWTDDGTLSLLTYQLIY
jgi:hypothetical protein